MIHRDRVRLFPGEVGSRGRCEPHRLGELTSSGGERPRPKAASRGASTSFRPPCDAHTSRRRTRLEQYPNGLNQLGSIRSGKIALHFKKIEHLYPSVE